MKEINKGILAKKIGMTQVFEENGTVIQATVLEILENVIVQSKTVEKDGYQALKVGYNETKEEKLTKPVAGQLKEVKQYFKNFAELRLKNSSEYKIGDSVKADAFGEAEKVNVSGVSKGRGFTGTVKRYNFKIGPMAHGSKNHRRQGSIGAGTGQGKVWKGQKMPGHHGNSQITVKNLKIVKIINEKNLIIVKGSVPGANGKVVKIYN